MELMHMCVWYCFVMQISSHTTYRQRFVLIFNNKQSNENKMRSFPIHWKTKRKTKIIFVIIITICLDGLDYLFVWSIRFSKDLIFSSFIYRWCKKEMILKRNFIKGSLGFLFICCWLCAILLSVILSSFSLLTLTSRKSTHENKRNRTQYNMHC